MNKVISNDKAGNRTETEPVFTQERDPFGTAEAVQDEQAVQAIEDRMIATGVDYSGTVVTERYHSEVSDRWMSLREVADKGGKISRLRMLREYIPLAGRMVDISYIHATLPSGEIVHVHEDLPQSHLIPVRKVKGVLIAWAKEQGVFAKAVGLLDESNWSTLG
jgi:hypothetical protein